MKTCKVIKILNPYSIIIDYGKSKGATVGNLIQVVEIGPKITDPCSGRFLGTLDYIKDELQITEVFDEFSICKKKKKDVVLPTFVNPFKNETNTLSDERLLVNKVQIENIQRPQNKFISLGDTVKIL